MNNRGVLWKKNCKYFATAVRDYTQTMEAYKYKLNKTKQACDNAKSNNSKQVKLNSQDVVATENSNKILKSTESILKIFTDGIKMGALFASGASRVGRDIPETTTDNIQTYARDAENAETNAKWRAQRERMGNNLKEYAKTLKG